MKLTTLSPARGSSPRRKEVVKRGYVTREFWLEEGAVILTTTLRSQGVYRGRKGRYNNIAERSPALRLRV